MTDACVLVQKVRGRLECVPEKQFITDSCGARCDLGGHLIEAREISGRVHMFRRQAFHM